MMRRDRCIKGSTGALRILAEIQQFAHFTAAEQRYIRRSLDVAQFGADAAEHWARGMVEAAHIGQQANLYRGIDPLKTLLVSELDADDTSTVLPTLIKLSAFDLQNGKLTSFGAYRFLYERLFGAPVRPWLLSAFSAAATLPCIHPELRAELMRSLADRDIREAGWSNHEASFIPEWVEKVPTALL